MKRVKAAYKFGANRLGLIKPIRISLSPLAGDDGAANLHASTVRLNKSISVDRQITALFHELIHFAQWQNGQLGFDYGQNSWTWNGVVQTGNYWHQKHEIDARLRSVELSREFNRSLVG